MKKTNKLFTKLSTIVVSLAMALGVGVAAASNGGFKVAEAGTTTVSFVRNGTTNNLSTGYSMVLTNYNGKTDYYQDKNTDTGLDIGFKKNGGNIWDATPESISFTAKVGGGSTKNPLVNNVTANLIDSSGNAIAGTEVTVTTKVENTNGKEYTVSITPVASAAGVMIHHEKESSYNIRVFSFSLTITTAGVEPDPTYTVTYNANGGSGTMTDENSPYDSGAQVTILENAFTAPNGKQFEKWYTTANGTGGKAYNPGDKFNIDADVTLYAQWEEIPAVLPASGTITINTIDKPSGSGSGYAAYDGSHKVEFGEGSPKPAIRYTSSNVMLQDNKIQFKSTPGYLYSTTPLEYIQSVTVTATEGTPVVYYGTTEHPTSNTNVGTTNTYFTIVGDGTTNKVTSIVITYGAPVTLNSITAALDEDAAAKTWYAGDAINGSDVDVTTSYSDAGLNGTITDGTGVYFNEECTATTASLSEGTNNLTVWYKDANDRKASVALVVNNVQAAKEVKAWSVEGTIGDTIRNAAYDLSGLTLHAWYDLEKTDPASSAIASLYTIKANPLNAGDSVNTNNTISIDVYLEQAKVYTIQEVPAPIVDYPKGTVNNPYTVEEALAVTAALGNGKSTAEPVYVKGLVSSLAEEEYNSDYGNKTFWLSDNGLNTDGKTLEIYRAYYTNADTKMTEAQFNSIGLGDKITMCGKLKKYVKDDETTLEMDAKGFVASHTPETRSISISVDAETLLYKDEFSYGGTVSTAFTNRENSDVTSSVTYSGYNMNEVGNQIITVHYNDSIYGELTETYQLTVQYAPVTSISLNHSTVEIGIYHEEKQNDLQLEATFNDHTNPLTAIEWSSNHEEIATVSSTGLVKGVADGQAVITARVSENIYATCTVTVTGDPTVSLNTSTITNKYSGDQPVTLTATANNFEGEISYSWVSSNTSAVTVTPNGNTAAVNFIAGGESTITVTASSTASGQKSAECTVTVTQSSATLDEITSKDGNKMYLGSANTSLTLSTKATVVGNAEDTIAWSSADEDIAKVSKDGVVTANAAGDVKITATSSTGDEKTYEVSVLAPTSLVVDASKAKTTYRIGDTFDNSNLIVTAVYSDQTELELNTYSVDTPDLTTAGKKEVEVSSFGGKGTYEITVLEDQYYTQINYASDLKAGDKLLLATPVGENNALSIADLDLTTGSSKYFPTSDVTLTANGIKQTDAIEANELILGGEEGAWTLANSEGKLLGVTSAGGGKLAWVDANSETAHTWTISIAADGVEITIVGIDGGKLQYNKADPRFTNYKTEQVLPFLYKVGAKTAEDILNEKKQQALADIDTFMLDYAQSAYSETNWTTIQGLVTDGKAKVNAATDEAGINAAVKELKDAVKAVKTAEQEAREALAKAIEDAEKELKEYYDAFDLSQYTASGKQALKNAYDNGMAGIKASQTLDMVATSKADAKAALDAVEKSSIVSIEITHLPDKVTYVVGDEANYINLEVTVTYNDQSTQKLFYTDVTIEGFDSTTAGEKTITVKYGDKSTSFTITVEEAPEVTLLGINLSTEEVKTTYNVGDTFDATGLVVTAKYSDGSSKPVTNYTLSEVDMATAGEKTITVTYEGKTATFTITVNDSTQPTEDVAAAKTAAINELAQYMQTLLNSGEYDTTGRQLLGQEYDKGIVLINSATTIAEVDTALANAKALLDAVQKTQPVDDLATAKANAIAELEAYVAAKGESNYSAENWATIQTLLEAARTSINDCTTIDDVRTTLNGAKAFIDLAKTIDQEAEEAAAAALAEAKTNAINELDTFVNSLNRADYSDDAWAQIQSALQEAKTAINNATDASALNTLVAQVKATINAVKDNLELAKEAAIAALDVYYNSFDKDNYDEAGLSALRAALDNGKVNIEAATTTEGVAAALTNAKADMDKVETKSAAPAVKRCGGDIAATSIILSTLALAGVGLLVFKKRKQD